MNKHGNLKCFVVEHYPMCHLWMEKMSNGTKKKKTEIKDKYIRTYD
jgi:hypothetical protein